MIPVGYGLLVLTMKIMAFQPVMRGVLMIIEISVSLQMKLAASAVAGVGNQEVETHLRHHH